MQPLTLLVYTGTFVFALTGALKARTHAMDVFGGVVLAFVTAYGGGTLRDLLIGIRPVNWINDVTVLALVLGATLIVFVLRKNLVRFRKTIFVTDAIGLGLFTLLGLERSASAGLNDAYSVMMGVISATFGGLLADVLSNEVPALLKRGEVYATACLAGGIVYVLMRDYGPFATWFNTWFCVAVITGIRILSKLKGWRLPGV